MPMSVVVLLLGVDHLLALDRLAHREDLVAQARRPLELERVAGLVHLLVEAVEHRRGVAVEEGDELVDERHVLVVVDGADARRDALLDVRVEARATEALVAVELALGARADRERAQQQVERLADRVGVGVGTEVADALALGPPHHHGPRPLLVEGDREVRVGLVVLQPDVEPGPVLLDEVVLEEQRLDLVAHRDPLDRVGGVDHLRGSAPSRPVAEVRHHPAAQALRLAHVEHAAVGVLELVRPRGVGDRSEGTGRCTPPLSRPVPMRPGELARFRVGREGRDAAGLDGMLDRPAWNTGTTSVPWPTTPRWATRLSPPARAEPHTPRGTRHAETAGSAAGPLHPRVARRARRLDRRRPRPSWANGSLILGPPLPARRGHQVGRCPRRLVQAGPLRRGQRPGHRHRVLRRALHGRIGRRPHRRPPAGDPPRPQRRLLHGRHGRHRPGRGVLGRPGRRHRRRARSCRSPT